MPFAILSKTAKIRSEEIVEGIQIAGLIYRVTESMASFRNDNQCFSGAAGFMIFNTHLVRYEIIIFSVEEKIRGRNLQGYNSAGEMTYSVWVNFWICFLPHYGLHDASWRGSFGGDIYEYDGSHGCVNLSYNSASTLYDLVDYDTPVIVLRGEYA